MNHIYETPQETARAVAELILAKAKEKTKQSLPFNIALSGGSTPKLLFTLLANEYFLQNITIQVQQQNKTN